MGQYSPHMGEMHLGARFDMAFQIICMQFDQAGHDQIAAAILCPSGHMDTCINRRDQAI